jgi:flagellar motor switch protein FliN/FliY
VIVDETDIDALLREADGLAAEVGPEPAAAESAPPPAPAYSSLPPAPELERILRLRVPVIVQLAEREMPISAVRDLSVGAIIEFEKSVDSTLDLLVNNRLIGQGRCVKVGENFGLLISHVCDAAQRIRSLGPA